jgi:hypothetical protein
MKPFSGLALKPGGRAGKFCLQDRPSAANRRMLTPAKEDPTSYIGESLRNLYGLSFRATFLLSVLLSGVGRAGLRRQLDGISAGMPKT